MNNIGNDGGLCEFDGFLWRCNVDIFIGRVIINVDAVYVLLYRLPVSMDALLSIFDVLWIIPFLQALTLKYMRIMVCF